MISRLYYEAHVTIEPLTDETRPVVENLCSRLGFKIAEFLMQRAAPGQEDVPANDPNSFTSARDVSSQKIGQRVRALVLCLRAMGVEVRRYKIEDTMLDTKHEDDLLDVLGQFPQGDAAL